MRSLRASIRLSPCCGFCSAGALMPHLVGAAPVKQYKIALMQGDLVLLQKSGSTPRIAMRSYSTGDGLYPNCSFCTSGAFMPHLFSAAPTASEADGVAEGQKKCESTESPRCYPYSLLKIDLPKMHTRIQGSIKHACTGQFWQRCARPSIPNIAL